MTTITCNAPMAAPAPLIAIEEEESLICTGILLARTVPEETAAGAITLCSAWWIPPLGGLTRVYPLPLRDSAEAEKAWGRYELELTKGGDRRPESYRLANGSVPEPTDGYVKVTKAAFRDELARLADGTTIKGLDEARRSLGVISPSGLRGHYKRNVCDPSKHFGRNTFGLQPYLHFRDGGGSHDLGLNEWGCYEWLRKSGDPDRLWANLRFDDPYREHFLLVGNHRNYPTSWLVISVITYEAKQPTLFVT